MSDERAHEEEMEAEMQQSNHVFSASNMFDRDHGPESESDRVTVIQNGRETSKDDETIEDD